MRTSHRNLGSSITGKKQEGVVLAICMIFIVVLTVIGVSSLERTEIEERMATSFQEQNRAFQVAETGIAQVLTNLSLFDTTTSNASSTGTVGNYNASAALTVEYIDKTQVQRTNAGWGVGAAEFHHFNINSIGSANNNASVEVNRGVRIVGASED